MSGFTITRRVPYGSMLKGMPKKETRKSGDRLHIPDWRTGKPKPAPVTKKAKNVKQRVRSKK